MVARSNDIDTSIAPNDQARNRDEGHKVSTDRDLEPRRFIGPECFLGEAMSGVHDLIHGHTRILERRTQSVHQLPKHR
ncbi:hypothetical protein CCR96_00865 [Halochromatium roseum]|nr:hypothetical protein [Halochromatium roseum]